MQSTMAAPTTQQNFKSTDFHDIISINYTTDGIKECITVGSKVSYGENGSSESVYVRGASGVNLRYLNSNAKQLSEIPNAESGLYSCVYPDNKDERPILTKVEIGDVERPLKKYLFGMCGASMAIYKSSDLDGLDHYLRFIGAELGFTDVSFTIHSRRRMFASDTVRSNPVSDFLAVCCSSVFPKMQAIATVASTFLVYLNFAQEVLDYRVLLCGSLLSVCEGHSLAVVGHLLMLQSVWLRQQDASVYAELNGQLDLDNDTAVASLPNMTLTGSFRPRLPYIIVSPVTQQKTFSISTALRI